MTQADQGINPKQDIALSLIIVDKAKNTRSSRDPGKYEELRDSMKRQGQLAPVRLAQIVEGKHKGMYDLLIGFGRYDAAKELGWEAIRAEVVAPVDATARKLTNLAENLAREDLSTYDQARAFYELKEEDGLKGGTIAGNVGKATSYVNNLARMWEGTDKRIKERWLEECSPGFGRDKDGKRIPGAMKVCTNDWLQKLVANVPQEEQHTELKRALGLIKDEDEDDDKEPGNGAKMPEANKRPGKPAIDKALTAAQEKQKEAKGREAEEGSAEETEKLDELNRLAGIIQALKWASGENQSIKGVFTNPKSE